MRTPQIKTRLARMPPPIEGVIARSVRPGLGAFHIVVPPHCRASGDMGTLGLSVVFSHICNEKWGEHGCLLSSHLICHAFIS